MQLDKTRIVIRQRSWGDILDLALHLFRWHAGPLFIATLLGAVPFAVLNLWLVPYTAGSDYWEIFGYVTVQATLAVIEAPLATVGVTLYLGQAMFLDKPDHKKMWRDLASSLPQLLVFHVLLRSVIFLPIIGVVLLYVSWPYMSEIILLERNRLFAKKGALSTWGRSVAMHGGMGGELFSRALGSLLVSALLIAAFLFTLLFLRGMLFGNWEITSLLMVVITQIAIWTVVGYFAVVRFLSYLDLRIRREGWEVDLRLRAEGERLAKQVA